MEKEKLEEGKKTFQEDKDRYERYKMDLQQKSNHTEDTVRTMHKTIENMNNEINDLKKEEAALISQEGKF